MKRWPAYLMILLGGLAAAWILSRREQARAPSGDAGLEVFIGEGCIHCHSQYRRPVGIDAELWGGPSDMSHELENQTPVLFGNRRQGPDLSNVGIRRSRDWNRVHLEQPRDVRKSSRMPAYGHLFADGDPRGEALLDYLQSLGEAEAPAWHDRIATWEPSGSLASGDASAGASLFQEYCAGCHGRTGAGNGVLATAFEPAPRDLTHPDSWQWVTAAASNERRRELARLIKFGRPGTSMAGTEWLTEAELANLVRFLETLPQSE